MNRTLLRIAGIVLILMGGLWTLQGLGLVMWPETSFMLDRRIWAIYGVLTMASGGLALWLSSRLR